jgi:hypothetical protein
MGFRTPERQAEYARALAAMDGSACPLCEKPALKSFTHWKILSNDFPYDRIAKVHHLIVPIAHAVENDVASAAWEELRRIKAEEFGGYDYILEPTGTQRSIPGHFHLHLVALLD